MERLRKFVKPINHSPNPKVLDNKAASSSSSSHDKCSSGENTCQLCLNRLEMRCAVCKRDVEVDGPSAAEYHECCRCGWLYHFVCIEKENGCAYDAMLPRAWLCVNENCFQGNIRKESTRLDRVAKKRRRVEDATIGQPKPLRIGLEIGRAHV